MRFNKNLINIFGLTLILIISFVIRIHFFSVPITTDEGGCAYTAHFWPSHQELYKDINLDRMQGLFIAFKIMMFLGDSVESIRIGASIYNLLILLAVFFITRALHSDKSAWISTTAYAIISSSPVTECFTASSELFTILPLTLSALFLWNKKWKYAGLFTGLALMFKPIGISGLIFMGIWMFISRLDKATVLKTTLYSSVFPVLALSHFFYIGWEHVWDTFITARLVASSGVSQPFSVQFTKFLSSVQTTGSTWIPLLLLSIPAFVFTSPKLRKFLLIWLGTSLVGMSMGGEWHEHYFIQLLPPVTVMGAIGIVELSRRACTFKWATISIITASILWFAIVQGRFWFMTPKQISWNLFHRPGYLISDKISEYIKNSTSPDDSIYIAFAEAELYYLSKRVAAVPAQLYWLQVAHNKYIWNKVVSALGKGTPELIILFQQPPVKFSSPDEFEQLILKNYRPDRKYANIKLYRKKEIQKNLTNGN